MCVCTCVCMCVCVHMFTYLNSLHVYILHKQLCTHLLQSSNFLLESSNICSHIKDSVVHKPNSNTILTSSPGVDNVALEFITGLKLRHESLRRPADEGNSISYPRQPSSRAFPVSIEYSFSVLLRRAAIYEDRREKFLHQISTFGNTWNAYP